MDLLQENTWLWRKYAEADQLSHDEICEGKSPICFWCTRQRFRSSYFVTDEDIELFKKMTNFSSTSKK